MVMLGEITWPHLCHFVVLFTTSNVVAGDKWIEIMVSFSPCWLYYNMATSMTPVHSPYLCQLWCRHLSPLRWKRVPLQLWQMPWFHSIKMKISFAQFLRTMRTSALLWMKWASNASKVILSWTHYKLLLPCEICVEISKQFSWKSDVHLPFLFIQHSLEWSNE